jgi:hypothetical protein
MGVMIILTGVLGSIYWFLEAAGVSFGILCVLLVPLGVSILARKPLPVTICLILTGGIGALLSSDLLISGRPIKGMLASLVSIVVLALAAIVMYGIYHDPEQIFA